MNTDITLDELLEFSKTDFVSFLNDNKSTWEHYRLPVLELADGEYAVALSDEDADSAAKEYIENSLWAFNSSTLEELTGIPNEMFSAVQETRCESSNDAIRICIDATCGIESFVDNVLESDGRGFYLALYNSEEIEHYFDDETIYLYRIN